MSTERETLARVAEQYRSRGYRVALEPARDAVPTFLRDYGADLIATSDTETVVVQVKRRTSVRGDERLEGLARTLEAQPGWRFEVVFVDDEVRESGAPLSIEQVRRRLEDARQLVTQNAVDAALLLAWSAAEAVLQQRWKDVGASRATALAVLKKLYVDGVIDDRDLAEFETVFRLRSLVAHGRQTAPLSPDVVLKLIDRIETLLLKQS